MRNLPYQSNYEMFVLDHTNLSDHLWSTSVVISSFLHNNNNRNADGHTSVAIVCKIHIVLIYKEIIVVLNEVRQFSSTFTRRLCINIALLCLWGYYNLYAFLKKMAAPGNLWLHLLVMSLCQQNYAVNVGLHHGVFNWMIYIVFEMTLNHIQSK